MEMSTATKSNGQILDIELVFYCPGVFNVDGTEGPRCKADPLRWTHQPCT